VSLLLFCDGLGGKGGVGMGFVCLVLLLIW
jgi:hypothetical protein